MQSIAAPKTNGSGLVMCELIEYVLIAEREESHAAQPLTGFSICSTAFLSSSSPCGERYFLFDANRTVSTCLSVTSSLSSVLMISEQGYISLQSAYIALSLSLSPLCSLLLVDTSRACVAVRAHCSTTLRPTMPNTTVFPCRSVVLCCNRAGQLTTNAERVLRDRCIVARMLCA